MKRSLRADDGARHDDGSSAAPGGAPRRAVVDASPHVLQGRYELRRVLGSGGEASVYAARDRLLGRDVAVKIFHRQVGPSAEGRVQQMEARVAASLSHYALTTLMDSGVDIGPDGSPQPFLVMEYVPGETLSQRLQRGPMEVAEACWLGFDLAEGLDYMHQTGFIHRDVKPSNILIAGVRSVRPVVAKLTDFGIAAPVGEPDLSEYTVGTAAYLSPEQVEGRDAEPASDVYSLGLVLLQAMTGRIEFPGSVTTSAFERLTRDPRIGTDIPPRPAALLRRMTAREPGRRIGLHEAAIELQQILVDDLLRRRGEMTLQASSAPMVAGVPAFTGQVPTEYAAVVHLAAEACAVPKAALLLGSGADRTVAAEYGWPSRPFELAAHPVIGASSGDVDTWVMRDLLEDPRLAGHPITAEPHNIRAAASVAVRGEGGRPVGALSVFDHRPRDFTSAELQTLQRAAQVVESNLQLRRSVRRVLFPDE